MAEQKDNSGQTARSAQSKRPGHASQLSGVPDDRPDLAPDAEGGTADKTSATVVRRKQRYLIGFRSLPGSLSLASDPFFERLSQMNNVEIIRRLPGIAAMSPTPMSSEIMVVRMDEQRGEALRQNAPPHVIVERDAPLGYSDMLIPELLNWQHAVQAMPFPRARRELRFRILGEGERPLANAVITMYGPGFPAQAVTDSAGQASLQTNAVDGTGIHAVYVRPAADHWERYIENPSLESEQVNVIRLGPLARASRSFPGERPYGWGQRIMKFDRVSSDWKGAGTKIGLIDSGCDNSHPLLRHVVRGVDFTRDRDPKSWNSDELGQGTHCAGIIAASAAAGATAGAGSSEMVGCAPDSELHIFKVVPGGHLSDLIDALSQCIERHLDIVQVGVSTEQFSEILAQKITAARLNGIACVAGAGNSGGAVQFPGNVPGVLTVSAVGKLGEYPQDTRHAQRALPQLIAFSGIYATNFSAWGPQVSLCAPGVAVVSSVPGGGYAAWDGTSMAASHVVGFSALLLSHHPMLQSINYGARADQRVSTLFDLLRAAAIPYAQVDPNRVGAGLPDLQQVPGFLPAAQQQFYGGPIGIVAGAGLGALQSPFALPDAYSGGPMTNALLQLRAAGLWV
ncbi:MAG TPA: S8 family serine peptidase [Steroidobacteraceae bacterium]|jgi:subtilisin family serine protease|nr:S8 family serine peptidase [Steroidobacteraceae bacterium]